MLASLPTSIITVGARAKKARATASNELTLALSFTLGQVKHVARRRSGECSSRWFFAVNEAVPVPAPSQRNGRALAATMPRFSPVEACSHGVRQRNYNKPVASSYQHTQPSSVDSILLHPKPDHRLFRSLPFSTGINRVLECKLRASLAARSRLKLNPANVTVGYIRSLVCGRVSFLFRVPGLVRREGVRGRDGEIEGPQREPLWSCSWSWWLGKGSGLICIGDVYRYEHLRMILFIRDIGFPGYRSPVWRD